MEKSLENIFSYIERVLPPYQFWLAILLASSTLLFTPENILESFGLLEISNTYKTYISLAFLLCVIIFIIKLLDKLWCVFKNTQILQTKDLNDEERAILYFYIANQYQGADLLENHPTIISLMNRNFIKIADSFIRFDRFRFFVLTKAAKKKLRSKRFQRKLLKNLDENNSRNFINSISSDQYSPYEPRRLS